MDQSDQPSKSSSEATVTHPNSHTPPTFPEGDISEILGLLELLKAKSGRADIYKLAQELKMEFGDTLTVIRGAELLGLVHTPGGDVVLEPLGVSVSKAKIVERKEILADQIAKIPSVQKLCDFLNDQPDKEVSRQEVFEKLAELHPNEDVEESFETLVEWGRFAELFGFDEDLDAFYLDDEDESE